MPVGVVSLLMLFSQIWKVVYKGERAATSTRLRNTTPPKWLVDQTLLAFFSFVQLRQVWVRDEVGVKYEKKSLSLIRASDDSPSQLLLGSRGGGETRRLVQPSNMHSLAIQRWEAAKINK